MLARQLLITLLDQRSETYLASCQSCQVEFNEQTVHALRVAVRRMLALIELLRVRAPQTALDKLRRALKAQLDSLDELRDTQVMLAEIAERLASLPALAPLQKALQKREKKLLKTSRSAVLAFKTGGIRRRIQALRSALTQPEAAEGLGVQLLGAQDDAYALVLRRMARVNPARPASIHAVRIAFKKFRYMLEILQPIVPGFPPTQFENMHAYQARMGAIQDVEVLMRSLAAFAARHKSYDPQPAGSYYQQRHAQMINAYLENMSEFVTFWRAAPGKAFPWEILQEDN